MFSKYHQSELAYLRDMGKAFSAANPTIAGFLAERGGDPDVARLLEGFAFLTARIRERIDDAVPEVLHGLTELLLPHYLRPVPACSVVEFTPQARALRGRVKVPAGTQLAARPVDDTACLFRTTADIDLLPLTVLETTLDATSGVAPRLRVQLQTTAQGRPDVFGEGGVRLFLHGDLPVTSTLALWLTRHLRGVTVRDPASGGPGVRLPPSSVQWVGLDDQHALFPWPKGATGGHRALQELFTLPQKYLFFELHDLAATGEVPERFELIFDFERPPPLPARLGKDVLRLHCVPVINLFSADADPIRRDPLAHETLLRATGLDPAHMEVYAVESVTGLRAGEGGRRVYPPFFSYAHATLPPEEQAFFRVRRALSPVNDGIDAYLSIGTPRQRPPDLTEETLSIELTCTNRSLPARLQLGDISQPTASSPAAATFRNIVPVTKPIRPPLGSELHWRLLSHLALNQRSLADAPSLRALLAHYNFQAFADHPAGRANQLRIDAIEKVELSPARRFLDRAPVRGTRAVVHLEEAKFAGMGDAFLFGSVLDELFAQSVTVNAFNELVVRLLPSQMELTWPARSGSQPIL